MLSAESGALWRNELAFPQANGPLEFYAGLDWGQVSGPATQSLVGRTLLGGVLGLRGQWKAGPVQTQMDVFLGQPLRKPDGFKTALWAYGFSLSTQF